MEKDDTGVLITDELNDKLMKKYGTVIDSLMKDIVYDIITFSNKYQEENGYYISLKMRNLEKYTKNISLIYAFLNHLLKYNTYKIGPNNFKGVLDDFLFDKNRVINLMTKIKIDMNDKDYIFKYFVFINSNSFMYKINLLKKPIEFDIAESGFCTNEINNSEIPKFLLSYYDVENIDYYHDWVRGKIYMSTSNRDLYWLYRNKPDRISNINFVGWNKNELIKALKDSEYFKETVETETNSKGQNIYVYSYPVLTPVKIKKYKKTLFPILQTLSRNNLELLYRYINNHNGVNFSKLCSLDYMDSFTIIRMLKLYKPNFISGNYLDFNKYELCNLLLHQSNIKEEVPNISQDILYQPGGQYFQNIERKYKEYMNLPYKEEKKYGLYQKYIDNCSDESISLIDTIHDAIELGLSNKIERWMKKEDICGIIVNYIKLTKKIK